jgi:hypothetical protein
MGTDQQFMQPFARHPVPVQGPEERILALAASVEHDGCLIGASDGNLFFLEGSSGPGCFREVGSFDSAVLALSWSPDGEALAIATASGVDFACAFSVFSEPLLEQQFDFLGGLGSVACTRPCAHAKD